MVIKNIKSFTAIKIIDAVINNWRPAPEQADNVRKHDSGELAALEHMLLLIK